MSGDATGRWLEERLDDGVVVAQLNRPPANALTADVPSTSQRLSTPAYLMRW